MLRFVLKFFFKRYLFKFHLKYISRCWLYWSTFIQIGKTSCAVAYYRIQSMICGHASKLRSCWWHHSLPMTMTSTTSPLWSSTYCSVFGGSINSPLALRILIRRLLIWFPTGERQNNFNWIFSYFQMLQHDATNKSCYGENVYVANLFMELGSCCSKVDGNRELCRDLVSISLHWISKPSLSLLIAFLSSLPHYLYYPSCPSKLLIISKLLYFSICTPIPVVQTLKSAQTRVFLISCSRISLINFILSE